MPDVIDEKQLEHSHSYFVVALQYLLFKFPKSPMSEIMLVISQKQLLELVRLFGGKSIRLPSIDELKTALNTAMALHMRLSERASWRTIKETLKINGQELNRLKEEHKTFERYLRTVDAQLPEALYEEPL